MMAVQKGNAGDRTVATFGLLKLCESASDFGVPMAQADRSNIHKSRSPPPRFSARLACWTFSSASYGARTPHCSLHMLWVPV